MPKHTSEHDNQRWTPSTKLALATLIHQYIMQQLINQILLVIEKTIVMFSPQDSNTSEPNELHKIMPH